MRAEQASQPTQFQGYGDDPDISGLGYRDEMFGYGDVLGKGDEPPVRRVRSRLWAAMRRALRWICFAAVVGGVGAMVVVGREVIVDTWPAAGRLYEAIGLPVEPPGAGLQLQSVKSEQRVEDGTVMLVVEGQILNTSEIEREVPPLLAVSIGPDHQPVHKWRIPVTQSHLSPGAIATFHSIERDPGVVSEVAVTFGEGE